MLSELFYAESVHELEYFKRAAVQFSAFTAKSPAKETANEDCAGWIRLAHDKWVFIVADGLGGLPAGEAASQLAVQRILKTLSDQSSLDTRSAICLGIDQANEAILSSASGGATTIVIAEYDQGYIRPYHIGDATMLVTGQRGKNKFQSVSHSPTGYLEEAGIIDEHAAMTHHQRHIVSNVLGSTEMRLEIGPKILLAKYDTVVIASDGLQDNLASAQVIDLVRRGRLEQSTQKLIHHCHASMNGENQTSFRHPDDLTLITIRRSQ